MTAEQFRLKWQKENPNTIHIPSEHEIYLMKEFASESNKELRERLANALDEITENKLQGNEEFRAMSKEISELKSKLEVAEKSLNEAKTRFNMFSVEMAGERKAALIYANDIEITLSQIKQTK